MKLMLCLQPKEDVTPQNSGSKYVFDHKSDWIDISDFTAYITVGYVKGCDFAYKDGKTYILMKTFLDVASKTAIILAEESIAGYDQNN